MGANATGIRAARHARSPRRRTRRASIRSGGRGGGAAPAGSVSNRTLYSTFGVVTTTTRGRAWTNTHAFECRETRRIEVLDDFDDGRGVEAGQPTVAVGQRTLHAGRRVPAGGAPSPELQPARRALERPPRHIDTDDAFDRTVRGSSARTSRPSPQPRSTIVRAPASRNAPTTALDPLVVEADRPLDRRFFCVVRGFLGVGILGIVVDRHETRQRVASQPAVVPEIATGDELPVGMRGEPRAAAPQQLVDLVGADPVVLVVVEHRQQHEEVLEQRHATRSRRA